MSKKIILSSGHGMLVSGARGVIDEVTEARRVVNRVTEILKSANVNIVTFHENNEKTANANLNSIVRYHNSQQRDLDVSIHFNAIAGIRDTGIGVETLYRTGNIAMGTLASRVSKEISEVSGLILRHPQNNYPGAVARNNLGFLNGLQNSILLEVCFVNSKMDVQCYQSNFEAICNGIAKVIGEIKTFVTIASPAIPPVSTTPPSMPTHQSFPIQKENIQKMIDLKIISTPEYWSRVDSMKWLNELMQTAGDSEALDKDIDRGITSITAAFELLTVAGIMNSPDYWKAAVESATIAHLGPFILNMANRVSMDYNIENA